MYICMYLYVYIKLSVMQHSYFLHIVYSSRIVEGSLEVKLPAIWTDGKAKV